MNSGINDISVRSSSVGRGRKNFNASFSDTKSNRSVNSDFNKSYSSARSTVLEKNKKKMGVVNTKGDLKVKKEMLLQKELKALIEEKKKRIEYN